jgi:alkanesulfonate monooxygenase SsuD/methylene tetrahydromethanopterin reductase-like flavin-dependent oxidoreductase (luciferase family)
MHFGQFNLMGYRVPGTTTRTLVEQAAEQVRVADRAGLEIAWFAEHHFSNYCVCPSPLMMVARMAGETSHIRLGTAVLVIPLYNPVRLLAEIGMADAMCDGRLVLGVGSGYQPYEFERFGTDLAVSREQLEEFMDMLELAFTHETFSFDGRHFRCPDTHISARTGRGVPEVWIAGDNPLIHRMAARRGYVPMYTGRVLGADYLERMRPALAGRLPGRDRRARGVSPGVRLSPGAHAHPGRGPRDIRSMPPDRSRRRLLRGGRRTRLAQGRRSIGT